MTEGDARFGDIGISGGKPPTSGDTWKAVRRGGTTVNFFTGAVKIVFFLLLYLKLN